MATVTVSSRNGTEKIDFGFISSSVLLKGNGAYFANDLGATVLHWITEALLCVYMCMRASVRSSTKNHENQ